MTHQFTLAVCILVSAVTASGIASATTVNAAEPSVLIASNQSTWSYAALDRAQGVTQVREFHDMGASGVQQIDYVVNCSNQTMAMSGFKFILPKALCCQTLPLPLAKHFVSMRPSSSTTNKSPAMCAES